MFEYFKDADTHTHMCFQNENSNNLNFFGADALYRNIFVKDVAFNSIHFISLKISFDSL